MMTILKTIKLTKKFGELEAVKDVSFEVDKGESVGIIGPNGAGKTTLFNVITGFLKPTSGKVIYDNKDVTGMKPHKLARLGMIRTFQILKIFKNLSVYDNIHVISDNVDEILKELGLWEKRDYLAGDLPPGEMRILNIGMALATNPKLLLLDEPFSGLTFKESTELSRVLDRVKETGVTMVIIEHRLKELFTQVDRVIVLNAGRIISTGTPEEVVQDVRVIEAYLGVEK